MSACEHRQECHFFLGMSAHPSPDCACTQARFCYGAPEDCARLIVARRLGSHAVPATLRPGDGRAAMRLVVAEG